MKVPKFPSLITIPVLLILNILAWLYIYDDYMMSWVIIYPMYMLLAVAFTIAAEVAFGKPRRYKYIGINVCIVLLLLVLAQKYIPLDKVEQGLVENYHAHVATDVSLDQYDKAVKLDDVTLVAKNFQKEVNRTEKFQVFQTGELIEEITLEKAIQNIEKLMDEQSKAKFTEVSFYEVRYVGIKQKGGELSLNFKKDHIFFQYNLMADKTGFIWDKARYQFAGLEMPRQPMLFGDSNEKFKKILLKGNTNEIITVKCKIKGDKAVVADNLENAGYEVINNEPITVEIPFYLIANLAHEEYIEELEIE